MENSHHTIVARHDDKITLLKLGPTKIEQKRGKNRRVKAGLNARSHPPPVRLGRLERQILVLRCGKSCRSANRVAFLQLNSVSRGLHDLVIRFGNDDTHRTYRWCQSFSQRGHPLARIFTKMP